MYCINLKLAAQVKVTFAIYFLEEIIFKAINEVNTLSR